MIDPRHPVIVGAHELDVRSGAAEPIAMMTRAAEAALVEVSELRPSVDAVRVVKGIWPYSDPGRLVAAALGLEGVTTALTQIGGNGTYDLVNRTASDIVSGALDAAIVCGAETMRTRRKDNAEGRRSNYLAESPSATPDVIIGADIELVDEADIAAEIYKPVNFYALAESALRHRAGHAPADHLTRIAELWADGSAIAASNPHAWIREPATAEDISRPSAQNRMVAEPYTKLMTSNIDVDQGAAVVLCAYETAVRAGIDDEQMVFLLGGSGAHDSHTIRARHELDRSPALRISANRALEIAGRTLDDIEHLDLYSCFPSAVQMAQAELLLDPRRKWTITGGLTFAGGPYNGYCTQALAHAVELVRGRAEAALLSGNGGFFTKHSVIVLSGDRPTTPYRYERPQDEVDTVGTRPLATEPVSWGVIEAHTVVHDRDGAPTHAIIAALDGDGCRHWALVRETSEVEALRDVDAVGRRIELSASDPESARLT